MSLGLEQKGPRSEDPEVKSTDSELISKVQIPKVYNFNSQVNRF